VNFCLQVRGGLGGKCQYPKTASPISGHRRATPTRRRTWPSLFLFFFLQVRNSTSNTMARTKLASGPSTGAKITRKRLPAMSASSRRGLIQPKSDARTRKDIEAPSSQIDLTLLSSRETSPDLPDTDHNSRETSPHLPDTDHSNKVSITTNF
jgi:hypothetical protein